MQKQSKYLSGDLFDLFFSFEGRIGRGSYWITYILSNFLIIITVLFSIFFYTVDIYVDIYTYLGVFISTLIPIFLTIIVSSISITIKRYHDRGKSGYWSLMMIPACIPFLGIIFSIFMFIDLCLLKGEEHDNVYGKNIYDQDDTKASN